MPSDTIQHLTKKIETALSVEHIEIIDESHLHAGHAGARPGGNSHFRAFIVSPDFEKINRVRRHQIICKILANEMQSHIHALALSTLTPKEHEERNKKESH